MRLKKLLRLFRRYNKVPQKSKIPNIIDDREKIVRSIFSPRNISKSTGLILANAYRTPANKDEVSVNRLNYTNETFCKKLSKEIAQPEFKKNYFGLGLHLARIIRSLDSEVVYSPIAKSNDFHSDIKIGFVAEKGEPLPSKYQKKVNDLAKHSKLYVDSNPEKSEWTGDNLEY